MRTRRSVPWSEELDEHQRLRVNGALESGESKVEDIGGEDGLNKGERSRRGQDMREPHGEGKEGKGDAVWTVGTTAEGFIRERVSTCHLELMYAVLFSKPDHCNKPRLQLALITAITGFQTWRFPAFRPRP